MLQPVILSGGAGSRLWPMSREYYPKQFQRLHSSEHSLLQETALRLSGTVTAAAPLVVCNEEHRFLVAEQLHVIGAHPAHILLEPCARNTAPALALAALYTIEHTPGSLMLVMPADHVIEHCEAFREAVTQGLELAEAGQLVTFGIQPASPHTGYGYIRRGEQLGAGYRVDAFIEKPGRERAQRYLDSGDYLWNSGIFLLSAERYLEELQALAPDIAEACRRSYAGRSEDLDFLRVDIEAFGACRSESIDYAVMENTRHAAVVPMDPGWSDIGSWDAIFALKSDPQREGNAVQGDVLLHETRDSLVHSHSRLVATVGVKNLVVVETADAVLVADRRHAQGIPRIVEALKTGHRRESQALPEVYRPWGYYRAMVLTDRFQVKEIVVKPGAKLSLQRHHHRAEHWVVVQGTARVTVGEGREGTERLNSFLLSEDESTYIPLGTIHRLENPGVIPLRLIEVQTGSYLGEDDIIRLNDDYGRLPE